MKNQACFLLSLVVTSVLVKASPDDSLPVEKISAVLGHRVSFSCPWDGSVRVHGMYLQKHDNTNSDVFVDGFYKEHIMTQTDEYRNRTKVDKKGLRVEMRNISVSDEGLYKCILFFPSKPNTNITMIHLTVTANYSVPTIKAECGERKHGERAMKSCQLSCSAVGGYPLNNVSWKGLNLSLKSDVHTETSKDNATKTWSINQTLIYSCDQPTNVSCDVGGAASHTITICETESFPLVVIVAIVMLVIVLLLTLFVMLLMKHCCRRPQTLRSDDQADAEMPLAFSASET